MHRVLSREALQINLRRAYLDDQSDFLAKTSYATFPLQFIPRYGEAAKLAIETAALQAALSLSAYEMYQLHSDVSANAAELQQAIGRYSGVERRRRISPEAKSISHRRHRPAVVRLPGTAPLRPPVTGGDGQRRRWRPGPADGGGPAPDPVPIDSGSPSAGSSPIDAGVPTDATSCAGPCGAARSGPARREAPHALGADRRAGSQG